MLNVVSIGGFGHSIFVFNDMLEMDEAKLVGLAPAYNGEDISQFSSHALCKGKPIFNDYRQMLSSLKPDIAIVSTRLDLIADVSIECAKSGCHLICEKPLALNSEKLKALYCTIKEKKVKLAAMLSMRSEPQFVAARQLYKSGCIGQAVMVNGRKSYKWGTRPEWFGDIDKYGGTIGWIGIHALDFINYITDLEFKSVSAMGGNFSHHYRKDCDDNCCMILELSNGGHATISVDLFRPENSKTWGDDWIRIAGTEGVIEARGSDLTCTVHSDQPEPVIIDLPEKPAIFKEFILSLHNGSYSVLGMKQSFMLTDVCHCCQKSLERKSIVNITNNWEF